MSVAMKASVMLAAMAHQMLTRPHARLKRVASGMRMSQKETMPVTIAKKVSPAPRIAPLRMLSAPWKTSTAASMVRYSCPMAITSASSVKAPIICRPKVRMAASTTRHRQTLKSIAKRTPACTRSKRPAPMFCPQKADSALESVRMICTMKESILPAAP